MTSPTPRLYVPNGLQLTIKLIDNGQPAAVVLGCIDSGPANMLPAIIEQWRDAFWSSFRGVCTSAVAVTGAVAREVHAADGKVTEVGAPASNPAGGSTAPGTVASSCTLVRWQTTQGGRSGKGRTFLPGLPSTAIGAAGRAYTSAFSTQVSECTAAYLAKPLWAAEGMQPAILSFTKGTAAPITGGALASVIGVQRRRMR